MNLDNIYAISNAINEQVIQGKIKKDQLEDMYIHIQVNPDILYGIDKEYDHYPVIDPDAPKPVVATSFNDTINMTNLYLEGLNGDSSVRSPFDSNIDDNKSVNA